MWRIPAVGLSAVAAAGVAATQQQAPPVIDQGSFNVSSRRKQLSIYDPDNNEAKNSAYKQPDSPVQEVLMPYARTARKSLSVVSAQYKALSQSISGTINSGRKLYNDSIGHIPKEEQEILGLGITTASVISVAVFSKLLIPKRTVIRRLVLLPAALIAPLAYLYPETLHKVARYSYQETKARVRTGLEAKPPAAADKPNASIEAPVKRQTVTESPAEVPTDATAVSQSQPMGVDIPTMVNGAPADDASTPPGDPVSERLKKNVTDTMNKFLTPKEEENPAATSNDESTAGSTKEDNMDFGQSNKEDLETYTTRR